MTTLTERMLLLGASALMTLGWAAEPLNRRCPVLTDEAIDPAITVVWQGKTIGLCCQRCKRQFLDGPASYAHNLPAIAAPAQGQVGSEAAPIVPSAETHQHAQGDAGMVSQPPRLVRWLGRFHPLAVHLPIALALAAAIAELLYQVRGQPGARAAARFTIAGAALGAVPATLLGWFAASSDGHPGLEAVLAWHRWLGTTAMVLLITSCVILEAIHRRQPSRRLRFLPMLLLVSVGALVGVVGHLGGMLVFGPGHLAW